MLTHDFPSLGEGAAILYGTYDLDRNEGFVKVGTSHATAEFAVERVRRWWKFLGRYQYPNATLLLLCADSGGSNGNRNRAWKYNLQSLANHCGLTITVCHYPPGTSKWNKIEHRMFSFISMNWRGRPLVSYEAVLNLIGSTKPKQAFAFVLNSIPLSMKPGWRLLTNKWKKSTCGYTNATHSGTTQSFR